jgi:hypothetical protein
MAKGVPFNVDRGYQVGVTVWSPLAPTSTFPLAPTDIFLREQQAEIDFETMTDGITACPCITAPEVLWRPP